MIYKLYYIFWRIMSWNFDKYRPSSPNTFSILNQWHQAHTTPPGLLVEIKASTNFYYPSVIESDFSVVNFWIQVNIQFNINLKQALLKLIQLGVHISVPVVIIITRDERNFTNGTFFDNRFAESYKVLNLMRNTNIWVFDCHNSCSRKT
ncbi:hypothetical protein Dbac_1322 [Desulfomicrobium baculatum DSM 4028]|uniref:Uncharacterized protein n=1 Tax=Desulfomicrobium baculatum (strain DSM 4028 / VKM B-1378 / X) TaxID=525897 RepID=C7LSM9_DESBD|nr:hypothetical protein Dbac_1322 [Desulfomicrobium baculatum DSM 4028]